MSFIAGVFEMVSLPPLLPERSPPLGNEDHPSIGGLIPLLPSGEGCFPLFLLVKIFAVGDAHLFYRNGFDNSTFFWTYFSRFHASVP